MNKRGFRRLESELSYSIQFKGRGPVLRGMVVAELNFGSSWSEVIGSHFSDENTYLELVSAD